MSSGAPLNFVPTADQIAREVRAVAATEEAERAWRREIRWVVAGCVAANLVGIAIGLAGFMVDRPEVGWALIKAGQGLSVLLPALVALGWWVSAVQRGEI